MKAYVANPPVPLARTLANINFDMLNLEGPTLDIVGLGSDETKLGRMFVAAAHAEGTHSPTFTPYLLHPCAHARTHARTQG
jgi:hypothetical protein